MPDISVNVRFRLMYVDVDNTNNTEKVVEQMFMDEDGARQEINFLKAARHFFTAKGFMLTRVTTINEPLYVREYV